MRVSLCMIVKNEQADLPSCLASVADLVDEIVVVDTGSTDTTREIAARYGARIVDFAWCDDFAAARNESLRHATGEWIFWLDADDRIDDTNRAKLRTLCAGLRDEHVGYLMRCLCPLDGAGLAIAGAHVRLFRRRPDVRWRHRVHEDIVPALQETGATIRPTDIVITHAGYRDPAERRRKMERNLRLLLLRAAEGTPEAALVLDIGSHHLQLQRPEEAREYARRAVALAEPGTETARSAYGLLVQSHRALGRPTEAQAVCEAGLAAFPDDTELLFHLAELRGEAGDAAGAEACLVHLLATLPPPDRRSALVAIRGADAHYLLATLYARQGRWAEATAQYRATVAERPDLACAWAALGELYLHQGMWAELHQVLQRLDALGPAAAADAATLRALWWLAQGQATLARRILEDAAARHPHAPGPRLALAQLQQLSQPPGAAGEWAPSLTDPSTAQTSFNEPTSAGPPGLAYAPPRKP
ncbi:MAG: glycosyltransferase [Gemmataceae bacterium]|nr:glycosyltransferase [Gemmataceae bacterium]MDW8265813.1 glycosyltransferase [Gemmataceae bacterium]